ncbi:MAG: radical SAM protein [Acidobacteriaceae bacterium]|nr:radical SAM protein [Acidobacteriaceae bacterium]
MTQKVTALWDLNESCNLRCQYCYHVMNGEDWSHLQQPLDQIQPIMETLRAAGVTRLYFVGGEPFLRKDLGAIAGEAKRLGFETSITTNGTVLPRYRDAQLMQLFDLVEVSLDSLDPSYMAEIRTVRKVGTIQEAITHLVHAGHRVQVLAVANKLNVQDLPNLVDWCRSVGVTRLKIQPIYLPSENRNAARLPLAEADLHALRSYANEIYEPQTGVQRYYEYVVECANGAARTHLCNAFSRFIYVTATGQLQRCPSLSASLTKQPPLLHEEAHSCNSMTLDCLCVYSLIEGFDFVLKQ